MKHLNQFRIYQEAALGDPAGGGGDGGDPAPADPGTPATAPADPGTPPAGETNWRTDFGEELQPTLERYATQADMGKAFMESRRQIKEGGLLKPLSPDATPEEVTAYREGLGLPADADGYLKAMPEIEGMDKEDMSLFTGLAERMLGQNAPAELFKSVVDWTVEMEGQIKAQQEQDDAIRSEQLVTELREEWGSDYSANLNVIQALLNSNFDQKTSELLLSARTGDGSALFNNRDFMQSMMKMGREQNPIGTVLDAANTSPLETVEQELEGIRQMMRTDRKAYDGDAKIQSRYRDLLTAVEKHKSATNRQNG